MKFLSAPWRWKFISKFFAKEGCVFCDALKLPEKEALICYRGESFFVILNKYPYTSGHLMIVPYQHLDSPTNIAIEDSLEMWSLMDRSLTLLKDKFSPQGFNVGMNLGEAAGAGVKNHYHLHIVPRWRGDANFMATVGQTKVVSYDINEVYKALREGFNI